MLRSLHCLLDMIRFEIVVAFALNSQINRQTFSCEWMGGQCIVSVRWIYFSLFSFWFDCSCSINVYIVYLKKMNRNSNFSVFVFADFQFPSLSVCVFVASEVLMSWHIFMYILDGSSFDKHTECMHAKHRERENAFNFLFNSSPFFVQFYQAKTMSHRKHAE